MLDDLYNKFYERGGFEELDVSVWSCSGEKAAVFLHGQLTNHIKGLKEGEGNYNLLLTTRGKIVGDLYVYRSGNLYYLVIEKNQTEKIIEPLKKLAPLSRVSLSDKSGKYSVVHVCTPTIERSNDRTIEPFPSSRLGLPGWDIFTDADQKSEFISNLKQKGMVQIDSNLHEVIRVEQGIARYGIDFDENNLPQEARLERALHFDKGCYLGQEIVARLHFRGHVNKILVGLKIRGDELPSHGTSLYDGEKEVGKITSCIWSPKLGAPLALGYLPYLSDRSDQSERSDKPYCTRDKTQVEIVELPLYGRGHPAPTA